MLTWHEYSFRTVFILNLRSRKINVSLQFIIYHTCLFNFKRLHVLKRFDLLVGNRSI